VTAVSSDLIGIRFLIVRIRRSGIGRYVVLLKRIALFDWAILKITGIDSIQFEGRAGARLFPDSNTEIQNMIVQVQYLYKYPLWLDLFVWM
jgi:hypothetical protein